MTVISYRPKQAGIFLNIILFLHLAILILSIPLAQALSLSIPDLFLNSSFVILPFAFGVIAANYLHKRQGAKDTDRSFTIIATKQSVYVLRNLIICIYIIFIGEALVSKGLPFLTLIGITPNGITYDKFGFPTIHGFVNASFYTIFSINAVFLRNKYISLFAILPFVLSVSRGWLTIVSVFLIALFVLANPTIFNPAKHFRRTAAFFLSLFAFVTLFGVIGNLRIGLDLDKSFWSELAGLQLPFNLPLYDWFYIYIVGTNLNSVNLLSIENPCACFVDYIFTKLPTALIPEDSSRYDLMNITQSRIHELVTTYNGYADIYYGTSLPVFIVLLFTIALSLLYLDPAMPRSPSYLYISIHNAILALFLFFNNFYLELPFIFPFIVGPLLLSTLKVKFASSR